MIPYIQYTLREWQLDEMLKKKDIAKNIAKVLIDYEVEKQIHCMVEDDIQARESVKNKQKNI